MDSRGRDRDRSARKSANWTARLAATLALVASAAAIVIIVATSLGGTEDDSRGERARTKPNCNPPADAALKAGFYIVKPEEDLSVVADRTCMTVERLLRLNPELDPQTIPVGACVSLRRNGCENAG